MMRIMRMCSIVVAGMIYGGAGFAAMFTWTGADGSYNATDRVDKLPPQYQSIINYELDHFVTPAGVGYERDEDGNFKFFDHTSPAKKKTKRNGPPELDGPPGSAVTPEQLAEVKKRYRKMGKEPRPEILEAKVKRIISADTFEIETGQKVSYIGIEFPDELKGETKIHQEVTRYQRKLMEGRKVHLLFGPKRFDDRGRMLTYVFVGTDLFVNADMVMNGYAKVNTLPPNTEYRKLFLRLQDFAKRSLLGIWDSGQMAPAGTEGR